MFTVQTELEEGSIVNVETRKSWLKRLKKQVKVTLMDLKSRDYKSGFRKLFKKGYSPISYPVNLKIPVHFTYPTEFHLFLK